MAIVDILAMPGRAGAQSMPAPIAVHTDNWSGVLTETNNAPFTLGNVNWVFEVNATFTVPNTILPVDNSNRGRCSQTDSPAIYQNSEWIGLGGAGDFLGIYSDGSGVHGDYLYQAGLIYKITCTAPNVSPTVSQIFPFWEIVGLTADETMLPPQLAPGLGKISPGGSISIRIWLTEFGFGGGGYYCSDFGCATWMHYNITDHTTLATTGDQIQHNPDVDKGNCPQYYWGCVPQHSGEVVLERNEYEKISATSALWYAITGLAPSPAGSPNATIVIQSANYNLFDSQNGWV